MVVFLSMILVNTPPAVSTPRLNGVTSRRRTSFTSPLSTPPWMAAPMATTSSGLTPLCGSLPKNCCTTDCTLGMRVMPPTRMTRSISLGETPASLSDLAGLDGALHQVRDELLELRAGHGLGQVLGPGGVGGDEGQVD